MTESTNRSADDPAEAFLYVLYAIGITGTLVGLWAWSSTNIGLSLGGDISAIAIASVLSLIMILLAGIGIRQYRTRFAAVDNPESRASESSAGTQDDTQTTETTEAESVEKSDSSKPEISGEDSHSPVESSEWDVENEVSDIGSGTGVPDGIMDEPKPGENASGGDAGGN